MQAKPGDDAREAVALDNPRAGKGRAEALGEGSEAGRAAGEVERVDARPPEAGTRRRLARRVDDARVILIEGRCRIRSAERHAQPALDAVELDARRAALGHR